MASAAFPIKFEFKGIDEDQKDEEVSIQDIVWDPMLSTDWNNQRPTSEAIVRIKRYQLLFYSTLSYNYGYAEIFR